MAKFSHYEVETDKVSIKRPSASAAAKLAHYLRDSGVRVIVVIEGGVFTTVPLGSSQRITSRRLAAARKELEA